MRFSSGVDDDAVGVFVMLSGETLSVGGVVNAMVERIWERRKRRMRGLRAFFCDIDGTRVL